MFSGSYSRSCVELTMGRKSARIEAYSNPISPYLLEVYIDTATTNVLQRILKAGITRKNQAAIPSTETPIFMFF